MNAFTILFLALLLEALPFVIIGAIISALIEIFVSPTWITNRIKGVSILSYLFVGLMGFFIPVCECAIIPIVRKLLKKGLPLGLGITFMLAVPIVNPVVLASTYYAFGDSIPWMLARGISGWIAAVAIGFVIQYFSKDAIKNLDEDFTSCSCSHEHGHEHEHEHEHEHKHGQSCACTHHHEHSCSHEHSSKKSLKSILETVILHSAGEIINVGVLLTFGAFISALIQVFLPKAYMIQLSQNSIMSTAFMMLFAFVLSLCSEADAFIASSFAGQLSNASILAFLIFGPMLDIKNLFMLNATFKSKFVFRLCAAIALICFVMASLYSGFFL